VKRFGLACIWTEPLIPALQCDQQHPFPSNLKSASNNVMSFDVKVSGMPDALWNRAVAMGSYVSA
jgi:hypothetical protein